MKHMVLVHLALCLALACKDKQDDSGVSEASETDADTDTDTDSDTDSDTDTDTDSDTDSDTDTDSGPVGPSISITGNVVDLGTGEPVAGGLCVSVFPVTDVMKTGKTDVLSTTTTTIKKGAFVLEGITEQPDDGLYIEVADCADEGTVFPSITMVSSDDYAKASDGDKITSFVAYSMSAVSSGVFDNSLAVVGWNGSLEEDGVVIGWLRGDKGALVGDVVVTGTNAQVYYCDDYKFDGLFTTKSVRNTASSAKAFISFAIPRAPYTTYTFEDANGIYSFNDAQLGAIPGTALILDFDATK